MTDKKFLLKVVVIVHRVKKDVSAFTIRNLSSIKRD
jgi:hypothetical protein